MAVCVLSSPSGTKCCPRVSVCQGKYYCWKRRLTPNLALLSWLPISRASQVLRYFALRMRPNIPEDSLRSVLWLVYPGHWQWCYVCNIIYRDAKKTRSMSKHKNNIHQISFCWSDDLKNRTNKEYQPDKVYIRDNMPSEKDTRGLLLSSKYTNCTGRSTSR